MEQKKDILTELYLDGALKGAELDAFLEELRNNQELQFTLALYRQGRALSNGKAVGDEPAFRKILAETSGRHFSDQIQAPPVVPGKTARIVLLKRLAVAAAVILAVYAGLSGYASREFSTGAILSHHYAPASVPATLSGEGYSLSEAFAAYRSKQYELSVRLFEGISPEDPQYAEAILFTGYAYYELGQYAKAAVAFEQVIKTEDTRFAANAQWHRLLALLADNPQNEDAQALLHQIQRDNTHPFRQAASKLERELNHPLRRLIRR